jgi:hypothetical protein
METCKSCIELRSQIVELDLLTIHAAQDLEALASFVSAPVAASLRGIATGLTLRSSPLSEEDVKWAQEVVSPK